MRFFNRFFGAGEGTDNETGETQQAPKVDLSRRGFFRPALRLLDGAIPEDKIADEATGEDSDLNLAKLNLSRRGFMAAAVAATVLTGCEDSAEAVPPSPAQPETIAIKYEIDALKKMLIEKYPDLGRISNETETKPDGTIETLEVINAKFRDLAMQDKYQEDPLVQAYFLRVSYQGLIDDGALRVGDSVISDDYLHPEKKIWPRKIRKTVPAHKQDMETAVANMLAEDLKSPPEKMDYQKFVDLAAKAVKDVSTKMIELKIDAEEKFQAALAIYEANPDDKTKLDKDIAKNRVTKYSLMDDFTSLIDADFLVGLSIHEVMPTGKELLNPHGYTDLMRIALLRTLFEKGFQINRIPAYHDDMASFGAMQMTVLPYEGRDRKNDFGQENEIRKVDGIIIDKRGREKKGKVDKEFKLEGDIEPYLENFDLPHQLCDCIDLEDQLKSGMILLLINFKRLFKNLLTENERFISMWNNASLIERRTFLAALVGTAHNNPKNAKLSLEQAIGWDRSQNDSGDYFLDDDPKTKEAITDLTQLRIAYLNIAKRVHPISGREGLETSNLVARFSDYKFDSEEVPDQIAKVSPAPAIVPGEDTSSSESAPAKPLVADTTDTSGSPKSVAKVEKVEKHRELKLFKRERDGKSYYTFDVPNWKLEYVADILCGDSKLGTMEAIKKFNKTQKFKPGDPILIPVQFMRKELQDPALVGIIIPKGKDKEAHLRELMKPGVDLRIAVLYNPIKPPAAELNDLGDVIRMPKSLIK